MKKGKGLLVIPHNDTPSLKHAILAQRLKKPSTIAIHCAPGRSGTERTLFSALILFLCSAAWIHFTGASMISPPPFGVRRSSLLCSEDRGVWHKEMWLGALNSCMENAVGLGTRSITQRW